MSDEIKTESRSGFGRAKQWATGFFYRKEGKKFTVVTKHLSIFCTATLLFLCVLLLIFGPQETVVSEGKSSIASPVEVSQDNGQMDISNSAYVHLDNGQPPTQGKGRASSGSKYSGPQVVRRSTKIKIPPGTMVQAVLMSGASDGPVRAEVQDSFTLQGETLIEAGTVLLGVGQSTDSRLFIRFTQMVAKDGGFTSIQAQACDAEDKIAGLKGSQVGTQAFKLAAGIGLNFVGGMSQALQESEFQNGFGIRRPNARNVLLNGASTATIEQSQELLNEYRNKPPKMEVAQGIPIFVLFEGNQ